MLEGPDDKLVLRLWRWDAERLKSDAERDVREQASMGIKRPQPSVSAFATSREPNESIERTKERLIETALESRNAKWAAFTTKSCLEKEGFEVAVSEPPPGHHDIVIGDTLDDSRLVALEKLFNRDERVRIK